MNSYMLCVDYPRRSSDLEQRARRIVRHGYMNSELHFARYVT